MTDNKKPSSQSDAKSDALPMVVAITGASGAIYGLRLLQYLMEIEQPVDLLLSRAAMRVMQEEHDLTFEGDVLSGLFVLS
jgi:3-polyprenyl-4-hydroxybenzoate decarboxylase